MDLKLIADLYLEIIEKGTEDDPPWFPDGVPCARSLMELLTDKESKELLEDILRTEPSIPLSLDRPLRWHLHATICLWVSRMNAPKLDALRLVIDYEGALMVALHRRARGLSW